MANFDRIVEQKIREAMQEGKFDNLKGAGKPLPLDENPYEPAGWGTAFRLLKDQGYTLPWIERGQEIEKEFQQAYKRLADSYAEYQGHGSYWTAELARFRQELEQLNQKIIDYNLRVPSDVFKRPVFDFQRIVNRIREPKTSPD